MRILFVTAFYPPYVIGGWEQLVRDINSQLRSRGHTTQVITSNYGVGTTPFQQSGVKRLLQLESDLVHYDIKDFLLNNRKRIQENVQIVEESVRSFDPDVVFIHVMWNLTRAVAWQVEQMCPDRVVYYIANDWPYAPNVHRAFWSSPGARPLRRFLKKLLAPIAEGLIEQEAEKYPLQFRHVLAVSQAIKRDLVKNAQIPEENIDVVYNGVEVDLFTPREELREEGIGLSLLYAGSLVSHKGVHTAIQALAFLKDQDSLDDMQLTIVGSGHPEYEQSLHKLVDESNLEGRVFFWPRVPREEMPLLLRKFDVLVFPSLWDEPLARMMQEAMACGLLVVGTPTGGTPEILKDGETGLTFPPGDAKALASQLQRLLKDHELRDKLSHNARRIVESKFSLTRMVDEIEEHLEAVAEQRKREGGCQSVQEVDRIEATK